MTHGYVQVSRLGTVFLPEKFAEACSGEAIRRVDADAGSRNQAIRFLKRGGTAVVTGGWPDICAFWEDVVKRQKELLPETADRRARVLAARLLRLRVLTTLDCLPPTEPEFDAAELAGFLGEDSLPEDVPALLPVDEAKRLLDIPSSECFVRAIDAGVLTHPDVLAPQSQETIDLVCEAVKSCEPDLPYSPDVLDLGCGSGVLTIAAWQLLGHKSVNLTATDILPEAVATTKLNWRRLSALGKAGPSQALLARSGSLFEPVEDRRFDLVIFNAPWVVAPARNRAELALNDERQATIKAFLDACPGHLTPRGRVIVGYASNAGPKAIARLESFIQEAGLTVERLFKDRIHTRRAKRQWQSIYAYVLTAAERKDG